MQSTAHRLQYLDHYCDGGGDVKGQSLSHSVTRSLGHSVTWSLGHSITWSLGSLGSLGHSVILSLFSTLLRTDGLTD